MCAALRIGKKFPKISDLLSFFSSQSVWERSPFLYYGVLFFLGISVTIHAAYIIPLIFSLITHRSCWMQGLFIACCSFGWSLLNSNLPHIDKKGVVGEGVFHIESISYSESPFLKRSTLFKGSLTQFTSSDQRWNDLPCHIYFSDRERMPKGTNDLFVQGKLTLKKEGEYLLKPKLITPILESHSLAQWRFDLKNRVSLHLKKLIPDSKSCAFLLSMITGEIEDKLLALEFNRLGLMHALGISGFQFTLLALLLGGVLRFFLPHSIASAILVIFLTGYLFMLGESPPIERAWISSISYLIASLVGYVITPLNALGVALLWSLIKEPKIVFHLGFQFTFLSTAAIFLTYPLFRSLFSNLLPRRKLYKAFQFSILDRCGTILASLIREAISLNSAIYCVTAPILLYHFHKISLLSWVYNLFLATPITIIYVLLVVGITIHLFIPFIGIYILKLTQLLTGAILKMISHPPALYDLQWRSSFLSSTTITILLTTLILGSSLIYCSQKLTPSPDLR